MQAPKMLKLKDLVFRKYNRDTIDQEKLKGLKASIEEHGVLSPILVRPAGKGFELIDGERRVRACRLIDADGHIPALVKECDDRQAEELFLVGFLQREDLTPWEESKHLADLKKLSPDARVEDLADQLGKSAPWVAQRLAIAKLVPDLRDLLKEQAWPIGHVVLLARARPEIQKEALRIIRDYQKRHAYGWQGVPERWRVKQLLDEFQLSLSAARWKKDDAELLPKAGACSSCPKRSSQEQLLFQEDGDDKHDRCLDRHCWQEKQTAFIKLSIEKIKEKHQADPVYLGNSDTKLPEGMKGTVTAAYNVAIVKKNEPGSKPAVFVSADRAGEIVYIGKPKTHGELLAASRKKVNQETGKPEPPSNQERLARLKEKRQARAVELWKEVLPVLIPDPDPVLCLAVVIGTHRRRTSRLHDGNTWADFKDCPTKTAKIIQELYQKQIAPVLVERLKLYGSITQEIKEIWTEASKQAVVLDVEKGFQNCYIQAAMEIGLPKNLAAAGVADPDEKLLKKVR